MNKVYNSVIRLLKHFDGFIEFLVRLMIVAIIVPIFDDIHDFSGKPMEIFIFMFVLLYWAFKELFRFFNSFSKESND